MTYRKLSVAVLALSLSLPGSILAQTIQQKNTVQLGKNSIQEVIAAMTVEEKAHLLVGNDPGFSRGYPSIFGGPDTLFGKVPAIVGNTKVLVAGSAGTTYPIPRLGIPAIVLADGPAGLRIDPTREGSKQSYYATAFPVATLLASTWDRALVKNVGKAMGNEVLEYGVDILLAPALNIHRNPLGGRNFEYYAEDPMLSGYMAAAMVNGIQSNGVGTSIKHFAANNNETNRMNIDVRVGERALQEIYLKGFKIAVQQSSPWTIMSSYNKINGTYANQSPRLLTKILRKEWKFNGFVMTDWFAGRDQIAQISAGNDMIMPGSSYIADEIAEALRSGTLDRKLVDRDLEHILTVILKSPAFKKYPFSNKPDLKAHAIIARQAAAEGMVLLKNVDNTLPLLATTRKIATFGNASYATLSGGTGSGDVNKAYNITVVQGFTDYGFSVDKQLGALYTNYFKSALDTLKKPKDFMARKPLISEYLPAAAEINRLADESEIALITISRNSGEFHDRTLADDFELTSKETQVINQVCTAFHARKKKVIIALNIGGVIETESWKMLPDAIILTWQPGQEAGHALANILRGKVNPSGKLPTTFPVKYTDVPSANNFPMVENDPKEVNYTEGVFVGYRYYTTFHVQPSFPFGYGLSYTKFKYGQVQTGSDIFNNKINFNINISNVGKTAGKEIVQVYITAPSKSMKKPAIELKNFAKTKLLSPGAQEHIALQLNAADIASFDEKRFAWVAEPGVYTVSIGASSQDIRSSFRFRLLKELIVEKVTSK